MNALKFTMSTLVAFGNIAARFLEWRSKKNDKFALKASSASRKAHTIALTLQALAEEQKNTAKNFRSAIAEHIGK